MTYIPENSAIGLPPFASSTTPPSGSVVTNSANRPSRIGNIVRAYDPTYGEGEFIYVKFTNTIPLGSLCLYDTYLDTVALAPATAGKGPVGVSMAAQVNGSYGWLQIGGAAVVLAPNAMAPGADVFMLAATPGSVDDAQVNGEQVVNAVVSTTTGTPGAGFGVIEINRPFLQGQIV